MTQITIPNCAAGWGMLECTSTTVGVPRMVPMKNDSQQITDLELDPEILTVIDEQKILVLKWVVA